MNPRQKMSTVESRIVKLSAKQQLHAIQSRPQSLELIGRIIVKSSKDYVPINKQYPKMRSTTHTKAWSTNRGHM